MKKRIRSFFHKYKHLWPLLYFFIYMPWFIILENNVTDNYHIMHCFMDDIIPFNEFFITQQTNFIDFVLMNLPA